MAVPETGGKPTDLLKALRAGGAAGDPLRQLLDDAARLVENYDRLRPAHSGTFFE